jgi:hypothetical protein
VKKLPNLNVKNADLNVEKTIKTSKKENFSYHGTEEKGEKGAGEGDDVKRHRHIWSREQNH